MTMTAIRLVCEPATGNPHFHRLDLMWDERAGTISGEGEDWIRELMSAGGVKCHPGPGWYYTLSADPLRNRTDMAALIGYAHRVPDVLVDDYPFTPINELVAELLDENGNVIGIEQILY